MSGIVLWRGILSILALSICGCASHVHGTFARAEEQANIEEMQWPGSLRPQIGVLQWLADRLNDSAPQTYSPHWYFTTLVQTLRTCSQKAGAWAGEDGEAALELVQTIYSCLGDDHISDGMRGLAVRDQALLAWLPPKPRTAFPRTYAYLTSAPKIQFPAFKDWKLHPLDASRSR